MNNSSETLLGKYQPKTLKDINGHDTIRGILIKMVENNNIPHILAIGPAGNGKSTTTRALIRDLYGENWKSNHVIFDSSTDRGIDVVRNNIREITRYKPVDAEFKIIVLEEFDEMTKQAQFALREIILKFQSICRFVLIANDISKIIHPIVDRCQVLRFAPLTMDNIANHMKLIVKEENIDIKPSQILTIAGLSQGSMRAGVNCLQSCATQDHITDDLIRTLLGAKFDDIRAKKILQAVYDGDQSVVESEVFSLVYKDGFTPEEIMHGILDVLMAKNDPKLLKQITLLAEYDFRMSQGQNKLLQLRVGLARLSSMKR
jgi:replication factor C small subunit